MGQTLIDRTELAEAPASGDFFHVVDVSDTTDSADGTSKRVQAQYITTADASTTVKGKVELATDAETITGTDTARAVTPSNITGKQASDAETITGSSTTKLVTPANITAKMDTDGTLAGNSDTRIPSQKAVKTYVDSNGGADWKVYSSVVPTRASTAPNGVSGLYNLTFAGVDLSGVLSVGNKFKLTQTAGSNTQSLDLESGSSQYAYRADTASLSITGTITMEAWIKLESLSGTGQAITSKWNQDGNVKSWVWYVNSDNSTMRMDYSGDGSVESGAASGAMFTPADIGRWVHVAVTLTPSTKEAKFYKNGVLINTATATGTQTAINDNAAGFAIGCRDIGGTPDTFFDGKIAEVSLWNIVRTQAQIQGDMYHNLTGNESGLAGYWKLDNAYTDGTANANDLTASGSPVFSADVPLALTTAVKQGYITAVSFSTNTTVTVATGEDFGIDDGTISQFYWSNSQMPNGFPDWLSATPIVDWSGTDPTGVTVTRLKFRISGRELRFVGKQNNTGAGTSNTQVSFDGLPVPPSYAGGLYNYPCTAVVSTSQDSGASTGSTAAAGFVYAGAPTIYAFFTSQAAKSIYISGGYEI